MPTVLRILEYRFFFFSNEGYESVHIDVESGDGYTKFWLNPVILEYSSGYNSTELNKLHKLTGENANLFIEKWYEYFGKKK
jgi:hypothetical protein